MCYRIRQEQREHQVSGTTLTPPSTDRLRPRLVGLTAAALVAGLATAAIVVPSMRQAPTPTVQQQLAAPAAPIPERTTAPSGQELAPVGPGLVLERTTISGDDGVPTNSDVAGAVAGGCSHEL